MNATQPSARDTRIDVFRALALLTIYINHVPGNPFEQFTHKNAGFSDSAEAFVLISGIAAGLAYGSKFRPGARLATALKAWRRAGVLYVTHMMTTVATLAIFSAGALWFAEPELMTKINIEAVMDRTAESLLGLVTLGHQLGYNNILSMYAVVLLLLPAFLVLAQFSLALTVAASGALWLASGLLGIAPPNFPTDGVWFLNPFSWQFLFVIGLAGAMHVKRGGRIPFNPLLAAAAGAFLLVAFLWVRIPLWGVDASFGLPTVLTGFDKTYLSAPRLLHVLAAAYLIVSIPAVSGIARTAASHPLAVLGRQALPVFIAGTVLAMAAQVLQHAGPAGPALDIVLILTGVLAQFAIAYWIEWLPSIGWTGKRAAAKPAQVAAPALVPAARAIAGTGLVKA